MSMNLCMIGHGMMGGWHTAALRDSDVNLHTLVGRQPDATEAFAAANGYSNWTTDYHSALSDPDIDVVVVAGPSQTHAEMGMAALNAGKHVLVEIPLALTLGDCEAMVRLARQRGLQLGVVHPMRFRKEHVALVGRLQRGEEKLRHVHSRLFLHRLTNVGSTGLQRSWTDNLLWHHGAHLVDVGLWLAGAGEPQEAESRISRAFSVQSAPHEQTGMPMELAAIVETGPEQSIISSGSYHSKSRVFDIFVVTDRDSYHLDILTGRLTTSTGTFEVTGEEANNAQVARDFIAAIREGRDCAVTGDSVLPAMRLLQRFEDENLAWRRA